MDNIRQKKIAQWPNLPFYIREIFAYKEVIIGIYGNFI